MRKTTIFFINMLNVLCLCVSPAFGQDSKESLAKAAQNPIANMISLPIQNIKTVSANDTGRRSRCCEPPQLFGACDYAFSTFNQINAFELGT